MCFGLARDTDVSSPCVCSSYAERSDDEVRKTTGSPLQGLKRFTWRSRVLGGFKSVQVPFHVGAVVVLTLMILK